MLAVFFYISGHGFGHAAREMAVINALGSRLPDHEIVVRTSAPRWLFHQTVRVPISFVEGETDTGIVQIDSLRLDEPATIARASEFYRTLPARAAPEDPTPCHAYIVRASHASSAVPGRTIVSSRFGPVDRSATFASTISSRAVTYSFALAGSASKLAIPAVGHFQPGKVR